MPLSIKEKGEEKTTDDRRTMTDSSVVATSSSSSMCCSKESPCSAIKKVEPVVSISVGADDEDKGGGEERGVVVPMSAAARIVSSPQEHNRGLETCTLLSNSGTAMCCQIMRENGNERMRPMRASRRVVYSITDGGRGPGGSSGRAEVTEIGAEATNKASHAKNQRNEDRRQGDDTLTTALSALYAKLLVVLGIALPVTEVISTRVPASFYQGFYLYLYSGSLLFVFLMHAILLRQRAVFSIVRAYGGGDETGERIFRKPYAPIQRYCSFYLRVGAIGFGIGSMIYSGLEFGQFFELRKEKKCHKVLQAITPVTRMILTIVQMQFIFLNNKQEDMRRHKTFARFGLMHMIAMNMCQWLYVIVEETKHEIVHLRHQLPRDGHHSSGHEEEHVLGVDITNVFRNSTHQGDIYKCRRTNIMGTLVQNASPFLFPCTIEYSLICAVILYAMWKDVSRAPYHSDKGKGHHGMQNSHASHGRGGSVQGSRGSVQGGGFPRSLSSLFHRNRRHSFMHKSPELFSVDCANAHRGLFAGILVLVLTIISLITFFVLVHAPGFAAVAVFEVTVCEMVLYVLTTVAVILCAVQMRDLRYLPNGPQRKLGLDNALLITAQTGMYVYCMFAIVGAYFAKGQATPALFSYPESNSDIQQGDNSTDSALVPADADPSAGGVAVELCSLVQTTCQTIFVLDACCRRCRTVGQFRRKPGRQLVTFLLVANMAMWTINTLEKNRAEFHPTHLQFYGVWAWTIITHVSMPLAIFYRFHSTVCLYEIWKVAYKMKPDGHWDLSQRSIF